MDPHDQAPDSPQDELQRARDQKRLAEQIGNIKQGLSRISAFSRMQARILMWTGALSEDDVLRMLRAQILTLEDKPHAPCECYEDDRFPDAPSIESKARTDRGHRYVGPLDPLPVARNDVRCPLEVRALRGDTQVPCREAHRLLPKSAPKPPLPRTMADKTRAMALEQVVHSRHSVVPCALLHTIGMQAVLQAEELAGVAAPPPAPPPAQTEGVGDLQVRRLLKQRQGMLQLTQQAQHLQEESWREQLLYLLRSRRLDVATLQDLLVQVLPVTDEGWLPCHDDDQRTTWFTVQEECAADHDHHPGRNQYGDELEDDDRQEVKDRIWDTPEAQKRCPLEIRGLGGDRTVPCIEALRRAADPVVPDSEDLHYHQHEKREAEEEGWGDPDDDASDEDGESGFTGELDPEDPVVALEMRPCHLLGRFLARNLYPILKAHADHPGEDDHLFTAASGGPTAQALVDAAHAAAADDDEDTEDAEDRDDYEDAEDD